MRIQHKILPKSHTGKLRHHRHTSYGGLAAVIFMALNVMLVANHSIVNAAATDPVTEQYGVYAVVPGPVPTQAPAITNLASNITLTTASPTQLRGTCPAKTLVKVFKNGVFGGSALCQNGTFSLDVDLFLGPNDLTLAAYNSNDAAGPLSLPLHITRALPTGVGGQAANAGGQFYLTSDTSYRGVEAGQSMSWTVTINGGQAPYALSIGWGDGTSDLVSRGVAGPFTIQHTYHKAGSGSPANFPVTIQATDQTGTKTFLQLSGIVTGGQASITTSIRHGYNLSSTIRVAWFALIGSVLITVAFWLGERREKVVIKRSGVRPAW